VSIGSTQVLPKRTPAEPFNYLALEHIEPGTGRILNFTPTLGQDIGSNKFTFKVGDVLYGKLRPYLRKATVAKFDGVSATDLIPLRSLGSVEASYLQRYLLSPQALSYVHPLMAGIKMPRLRSGDLRVMPIPLAPLPEQRRIVAKIEALFEQSRTAREALDRIPPLLKRFRQSVLAAAFRGDLTRDWREQHSDVEPPSALLERIRTERRRKWEEDLRAGGRKPARATYAEAEPVETSDLPQLPEGWQWMNIDSLISDARYGTSQKCSEKPDGVAVLRIPNVVGGRIDLADLKYAHIRDHELQNLLVQPGDLLVVRTNGSLDLVGRAATVPELSRRCAFASYLIRLRPVLGPTLPRYVDLAFSSDLARSPIEMRARSTAGQFNVNLETLRRICLPLPPLEEMKKVVQIVDSLFSQAEAIGAQLVAGRWHADRVDQAILSRAFRGELVPQDPNDEPACTLLDRVRTQPSIRASTARLAIHIGRGKK
jgi:type I restriction enzyme S subunit